MKTPREIYGRAVAVALVAERALWEKDGGGGCDTLEEQIEMWEYFMDWLHRKPFDFYMTECMTEDEKKFMNTPVRQAGLRWAGPKSFLRECISPLLWCIGLLDDVVPYNADDDDWYIELLMQGHPEHDMEAMLKKGKMRSREEIEAQYLTAWLMYWRAVEESVHPSNPNKPTDVRGFISAIFDEEYVKALDAFEMCEGGKDMYFDGKLISDLDGRELYYFGTVALMRRTALEWVLGDEDWDDTPTDT